MSTTSPLRKKQKSDIEGLKDSVLGDYRRDRTFDWLIEKMESNQSCVINKITANESERKRAQRLINNKKLSVPDLIEACCLPVNSACLNGAKLIHVIDQSTVPLNSAMGRTTCELGKIDSLGVVSNGDHCGQNLVVGLAVRKLDYSVLGLTGLLFHSVDPNAIKSKKRLGRDIRPFEYRNTNKWVELAQQANIRAQNAEQIIHVADREADSLSVIGRMLQHNGNVRSDLIIRASFSTRQVLACQQDAALGRGKISELLMNKDSAFCYTVDVRADERLFLTSKDVGLKKERQLRRTIKQKGRKALLEVRHIQCKFDKKALTLVSNSGLTIKQIDKLLEETPLSKRVFTYIQVREVDVQGNPIPQIPGNKHSINWLILTSCETANTTQGIMEVIDIYRQRFPIIEQFFRCMKKDGFKIEQVQQQTLESLQIVIAMAAKASSLIMKMISARNQDEGFDIEDDFSAQQIEVLNLCLTNYQGNTPVQTNHHPADQLSWAVWIVARMGGWKPENKQRPPGPKTLQRGMETFQAIYFGVALANGWNTNVSQP